MNHARIIALARQVADIMSGESDDARELAQWIIQTQSRLAGPGERDRPEPIGRFKWFQTGMFTSPNGDYILYGDYQRLVDYYSQRAATAQPERKP